MNRRIRKSILPLLVSFLNAGVLAAQAPTHPAITGVAGIRLLAANLEDSRKFYGKQLGLAECHSDAALCFQVNTIQKIEIDALVRETGPNRLVFVAFQTRDAAALRQNLASAGIQVGNQLTPTDGTKFFEVLDPENHTVRFVQYPAPLLATRSEREVQASRAIIHVGYVVQNRTAMDHFYRDTLGFRLYWHGGMKDDQDNWVAMQVSDPHGRTWLEYMLNVSPNADRHTLGVMNHLSLGVDDIHATQKRLLANGWTPGEAPKIGRDGKWQLNLYDPDDTRVEFMEFTPAEKPCCNPFTGPHPGPQR